MPGKSRHGKRKRSFQSKKGKGRRSSPSIVTQQQPVPQTYKPVAPSVSAPAPMPAQTATQYPHTLTELRRIGILAGIMLAILVVLALVLS